MIGRMDWVWPAMEVRPSAEVIWRKDHVADEQGADRHALEAGHQGAGALLQAGALDHADHGQDQEGDADIAVLVERLAEGRQHFEGRKAGGEARRQRRGHDHQQRVEAGGEAHDHHGHAQQDQHRPPFDDLRRA
jgi:hypothetical protein